MSTNQVCNMATLRYAKYLLLDISIQYYISKISVLTRVLQ